MEAFICGLALMTAFNIPTERLPAVKMVSAYNSKDMMVLASIESHFNQQAVSPADAVGVMQLTEIAVHQVYISGCDRLLPKHPDVTKMSHNILLGYCYFKYLKQEYNSTVKAVIAYNGGGRAVQQFTEERKMPEETVRYIAKFIVIKEEISECSN